MDNTELHYLTYDPDEIWSTMVQNHVNAGGDVLYPGDEKEMLLRGVQADIVQVLAGVDNALRMATLRYATGTYLDLIGSKSWCDRIQAQAAEATVAITADATGVTTVLPAGTKMTADGTIFYLLKEDVTLSGISETLTAEIVAELAGNTGNGLLSGTAMILAVTNNAVTSIILTSDTSGGREQETDDAYRERIRTHGAITVTTGPAQQYEAKAKAVSSLILDAKAVNLSAGNVGVYLILASGASASAIIQDVTDALSAIDSRPLTDTVTVQQATAIPYTLNVEYTAEDGSSIASALAAAVIEYQNWQDNVIGRAFNPDRLKALLYNAGASLVTWGTGSKFNGGSVVYTEITTSQHCSGTITLTDVTS